MAAVCLLFIDEDKSRALLEAFSAPVRELWIVVGLYPFPGLDDAGF